MVVWWTQLSRSNSLLRGYRPWQWNPRIDFLLLISEIGFKNLQNCLKVQCCKKFVKNVKKRVFSEILDLPPNRAHYGENLIKFGFFRNLRFLAKSKPIKRNDALVLGGWRLSVLRLYLKLNFPCKRNLWAVSSYFLSRSILHAYNSK